MTVYKQITETVKISVIASGLEREDKGWIDEVRIFLTDENILFDTVILTVRHHSFKSIELCNRRSKPYCMHIL